MQCRVSERNSVDQNSWRARAPFPFFSHALNAQRKLPPLLTPLHPTEEVGVLRLKPRLSFEGDRKSLCFLVGVVHSPFIFFALPLEAEDEGA